jgi:hypothetical protein
MRITFDLKTKSKRINLKKMKKILFSSAFSILVLISSSESKAQDIAASMSSGSSKPTRVVDPAKHESNRILSPTEVNVAAARDFNKSYGSAEEVTWVSGNNGTSVYFKFRGIKMRSTYDKKGQREYTLKYYSEAEMPMELRHLVKRSYYDYSIELVTEVQRNLKTSYLVKMQSSNEFLTLKVVDGEIALYERLEKAN